MEPTEKVQEVQNSEKAAGESLLAFPMSFAQLRLWLLDQLEPGNANYNIVWAIRLEGQLDHQALHKSLEEIVRRHEVLRARFTAIDEQPVQVITESCTVECTPIDLSATPSAQAEEAMRRKIEAESRSPINLQSGPLLRAQLLKMSAAENVLIVSTHHIVFDRWSRGIFFRELTALYSAFSQGQPSPLEEPQIQYTDYAVWQRQSLQGRNLEKQLSYWKQQLAGSPASLELPTDRPRPAVQTFNGSSCTLEIPVELTEDLKALSRRMGATMFMTLLAAFQVLLSRYSGQEDIVVGTPIANRNRAEVESLIGFFANTLVLRSNLAGNPTFRELLGSVRDIALGAYAHQDLPFEKLVEELRPERSLSHNPIFQVLFALQNAPTQTLALPNLTLSHVRTSSENTKFDISLFASEEATGIVGRLEYNTDLFERTTIKRMARHFRRLLEAIVASPETRVSDLPLLGQEELDQLLVTWNGTHSDYPRNQCLHQAFEAQVAKTPDSIAVTFDDQSLTYRELNERSNRLAHYLRKRGAEPKKLVGIFVERSLEMMVALLAVQKTGAAYVPLDPAYPPERLRFMIEDGQFHLLVTQEALLDSIPGHNAQVVCFGRDEKQWLTESPDDPTSAVTPEDLVYVIFTSGSTGRPKGVQVPHRGVVNLLTSMGRALRMGESDTVVALASFAFDMCIPELYLPLVTGGRVVIARRETAADGVGLAALLDNTNATLIHATPTTWSLLLEAGYTGKGKKRVVGAEPLPKELCVRLLETDKSLFNFYGPTETTVWSTFHEFRLPGEALTIGKPLANTQVYIFDKRRRPVPIGVAGELYIGGDGIAKGYLNRPELTAEKFVSNPLSSDPAARLYRTGDLGRYLPDGRIEFFGRIDNQVKLRGFRIELGEIEAVLGAHPQIKQGVATVREDRAGDKRLVAYIAPVNARVPPASELRQYVGEKLPEYMVPSRFVVLDKFPLNANGKVDRKALPAPELVASEVDEASSGPRTPTEELLIEIWEQVLRIPQVSVQDNFFSLGGHSLLATQVMSRVRRIFETELPLRVIFESPTVAELAQRIDSEKHSEHGLHRPALKPVTKTPELPLSFAQQRLWVLEQLGNVGSTYNIPMAFRLTGQLDVELLEKSVGQILSRHESLRSVFVTQGAGPVQIIRPTSDVSIPIADLSHLSTAERESQAAQLATEEAAVAFDLEQGPLYRISLLRLGTEDHLLLVTVHHIVFDGWSIGVFLNELVSAYADLAEGHPPVLPALPVQYSDFAVWQREYLQGETLNKQLAYWKESLAGAPSSVELPTDRPRPPRQTFRGSKQVIVISRDVLDGLKKLGQCEGVTFYMTMVAALSTLLSRYSGQEDIVIGSPIAGRVESELENLIGYFANTLVLRAKLENNPTFLEVLQQVRTTALGAYAHQDLPFEKLVEELRPERDLSRNPLFQIMFALQNQPRTTKKIPGLSFSRFEKESTTAMFDLTVITSESTEGLRTTFTYNTDLFEEATIARMLRHFEHLLRQVAAQPEIRVMDFPLLAAAEKEQITLEWNRTAAETPRELVHQMVAAQAQERPHAVAAVFGDQPVTYAELNRRSNHLANYLVSRGARPDALIGIFVERSLDMLVALLGVLKAGAAYVPLDPAYPKDRIAFIAEDAGLELLITQQSLVDSLPAHTAQVIRLDSDGPVINDCSGDDPQIEVRPENLAYVLYTSGSTGKPKGVEIEHRNLANFLASMQREPGLKADDVLLAVTTLSFDIAGLELYLPLVSGAKVVIASREQSSDGLKLLRLLHDSQATVMQATPATWRVLLASGWTGSSKLKILCGGEALPRELAEQLLPRCSELWNMYGPTETTVWSSLYRVQDVNWTLAPIGRPIANTQMYVLDKQGQPLPIGVAGELYIGGDGLARGYWKRAELTAEKFVSDRFSSDPAARLYRTGDLARYLADGNLQYLSRMDNQVKVRGFRIELGEIESVLGQHAGVQQAVVTVREDAPGDKRLIAYLVAADSQPVGRQELRDHLKRTLPEYMLPSAFVFLDQLPLTPNGKVDRKALPAPELLTGETATSVPPRDDLEEKLVEIWKRALGLPTVGITDNFFEIGGHSLLAVRVLFEIKNFTGVEIPLAALFEGSTIEYLAKIVRKGAEGLAAHRIITAIQESGARPAFFAAVIPGVNALGYVQLSRYLGTDQPFYKIQGPGQMIRHRPYTQAEYDAFAADYVKAMREVQPKGPYYIGGMCEGARIAFDMARQLEAQGEKVALLAILDTWVVENSQNRYLWKLHYYRQRLRSMRLLTPAKRRDMLKQSLRGKTRRALRLKGETRSLWPAAYWPGKDFLPNKIKGDVTLFRVPKQPFYYVNDDFMGWRNRTQGNVRIRPVTARHNLILREPYVRFLAESLRGCLTELTASEIVQIPKEPRQLTEISKNRLGEVTTHLSAETIHIHNSTNGHTPEIELLQGPNESQSELTVQQQRFWLLEQLENSRGAYNVSTVLRLRGNVQARALESALNTLIAKYPLLSAKFRSNGMGAVEILRNSERLVLGTVDLAHLAGSNREQAAREIAGRETQTPFNLERGRLFRASLVSISPEDHVLVLVSHRVVCDSASMAILCDELGSLYSAFSTGKKPHLNTDNVHDRHLDRQRKYFQSEDFFNDLKYWENQLGGITAGTELPTDFIRPAVPSYRGDTKTLLLPPGLLQNLTLLSEHTGVTLDVTLLSLFVTLLSRHTGSGDVVLGIEVLGRDPETSRTVGSLANNLVLRVDVSDNPDTINLSKRMAAVVAEAEAHGALPFAALVEHLHPERDMSRHPLFQVMFGKSETATPLPQFAKAQTVLFPVDNDTELIDLNVKFVRSEKGLEARFSYSTDLFEPATVDRIMGRYKMLAEAACSDSSRKISDLPLITPEERHLLVTEWNDTAVDYRRDLPLNRYIEDQVERTPDGPAVMFDDETLTYRELNRRANQLAHYLRRLGVGPDGLVGVCAERSIEMVVALHGVLKAGGAYVPLDPEYPLDRLEAMLEDANPVAVLTQESLMDRLPAGTPNVICLDRDWNLLKDQPTSNPPIQVSGKNLAYAIYTSGSTGKPKGVPNVHEGIVNRLLWMQDMYKLTAADRVLQKTPYSFDVSVWEFFWPLMTGACLVVAKPGGHRDPAYLVDLIVEKKITTLHFVPSMLGIFLEAIGVENCRSLRRVFASGEALPFDLQQRFFRRLEAELHNLYGPTEAAVDVTYWHCQPDSKHSIVPIGRPIANTQIYILDPSLQPVPVGVAGELHIGGIGLARGYLNLPELTRKKFIPDPFSQEPGARLYKTGDLARFLADGNIEYLGRIDHQVKLRGFRIELGEIESVLAMYPGIRQAVVLLREDAPGDKRLVAYLAPTGGQELDLESLRAHAKAKLPDFMVPSKFVVLEKLPMTTSGKVDRKALPAPTSDLNEARSIVAPRTEFEALMVSIFQKVLGIQTIGVNEDFFDLGGHSLRAAQIVSEIQQATGRHVPLAVFFRGATPENMARVIQDGIDMAPEPIAMMIQAGEAAPTFFTVVPPGENPVGYVNLARHMGANQSVYKLQGPGEVLIDRPYTNEEMQTLADEYVDAMRSLQPEGPYYFGGMCDGAHIALRMAHRLDEMGEKVGMLAVFDTWVLENSQRPIAWHVHYYSQRFNELRKTNFSTLIQAAGRSLRRNVARLLRRSTDRSAWSKAYWPDENFVPPTFKGAVTLFRRHKQPYYYVRDPKMGWGARALGGVEIQLLPIRHAEMLHQPNVQILGERLGECLRQTHSAFSATTSINDVRVPVSVGTETGSEVS